MKIYIDHFIQQSSFAERLANRIKTRNTDSKTTTFSAIRNEFPNLPPNEMDLKIIEILRESNIIIPIITSSFLSLNSVVVNATFNDLSEKKEKFIFPVIWDSSNWSSINWIVRSKVFPEGEIPLEALSDDQQEKVINELLQTIENITFATSTLLKKESLPPLKLKENIVFVSHDHDDADFAELLKLQFEKNGIVGWIDSERLKVGQDWREEIDDGIENSIAVVAIMSPEAKKSEYVTYEWAFAWGKRKKIFPIMLKKTSLHPRLESLQYLDFTNRATRPWDKLIASIKELSK